MFSNKLNYKIINFTALMLLLYIGVSNIGMWWNILSIIISVLAPFIIAFAFAYAFTPIIKFLTSKGFKKSLAVFIVTIAVILIITSLIVITLPLIYDQLILLSKTILTVTKDLGKNFNLNLGNFQIKITDYLNTAINNIGSVLSTGTISVVNKSIGFIGKFIVGFIAWIYFLADMENIREKTKEVTLTISKKTYGYVKCLDNEIGNYVKGLSIFMLIQLIEYSLLFLVSRTSKLVIIRNSCLHYNGNSIFWRFNYKYHWNNYGSCCFYSSLSRYNNYLFSISTIRWICYFT